MNSSRALRIASLALVAATSGAGLSACSSDAEVLGAGGQTSRAPGSQVTGTKANFCEEVVRHRNEYWTVAKSLTSVTGVKNLLSGKTDVSGLGPMWRDLAAAAPRRVKNEADLVNSRWATMIDAYEDHDWIRLTRTVTSMTGPMAEVNRFVRVTCGKKYGPVG